MSIKIKINSERPEPIKVIIKPNKVEETIELKARKSLGGDILIYDQYRGTFYQTGDNQAYIKGRNTIFINYQNEMHFEAMGVKLDRVVTFFDTNCSIIKEVKDKYYLNK